VESPASNLSPLAALEGGFAGTKGALLVDHTPTIKSVRTFKSSNLFKLSLRNGISVPGVSRRRRRRR